MQGRAGGYLRHIGGPNEHDMLVPRLAAFHLKQQLVLHPSCGIMAACIMRKQHQVKHCIPVMHTQTPAAGKQCQAVHSDKRQPELVMSTSNNCKLNQQMLSPEKAAGQSLHWCDWECATHKQQGEAADAPLLWREDSRASTSSMKMTEGCMQRASSNRVLTSISLSPTYLLVREEAEILKKVAFTLLATALPSMVLPVPGGPNSSMPLAGVLGPCNMPYTCQT